MHPPSAVLAVLSTGAIVAATGIPRGVSPEDSQLYTTSSADTFTCITHPSIKIPFSRVNDDYCDCPDGSDEPGTSACSILSPKALSIPGFYCQNLKHTPSYLPLSRVNDGVCDYDLCCDGSDEFLHVGGVHCENRCEEIGNAARKLAEKRRKHRSKGVKAKEKLLERARIMRKEIEDNISRTKSQIEGAEVKVKKLQEALEETERRERNRVVKNPTPGRKVDVVVQVAREKIGELKTSLERVKRERDEAERKLEIAEGILKTFKEEYNPNFNDEGVKRAVRAWEEYAAGNAKREENRAQESDLKELLEDDGINWAELAPEEEEETDAEAIYKLEEYLPDGARTWIREKLNDIRQLLVENGLLAQRKAAEGDEPAAVTEARTTLNSAQSDLQNYRNSLDNLSNDLKGDYGTNDVFRPLKGKCISQDFGEYTYEYCFLDRATQISLKDKSRVSLGTFARFETKDEKTRNDAAGIFASGWEEEHHEPLSGLVIKHEDGQQCWNGPKRSVHVELYCSAENEVRNVVEAEKCVYKFEVGTPGVCEGAGSAKQKGGKKTKRDEL